jgi:hypothetical protein
MKTALEVTREGEPSRVYHRTESGSYAWTHPVDAATRAACTACTNGTIPSDVRAGTYREGGTK